MSSSSPRHVSSLPVGTGHRFLPSHGAALSLLRLTIGLLTAAAPSEALPHIIHTLEIEAGPEDPASPSLWIYLTTALLLVLLGGAFAGLTIALMGQDEVYLQVIATSGEGIERKNAAKVLKLLKKGKHWVLVTLLVANVITNETLPIVLDRSIGGGYVAAIVSTLLVIIFGEIVPQSICVRYGLGIGAWMSNFVLLLMWIFAPVTWPTAKALDKLLGEDHGTTYKKAGLKTLVTLHKTIGPSDSDRLNEDEVTIISAVLDLKAKQVGNIMTPMNDVFTLPSDAVLNEDMMECVMREGYSRIPIHKPDNPSDFLGMLLVKMLITYDPEDALKVSDFSLATLPETRPETSCLDIINFFQQGKSHMVLVSDAPGKSWGAMGVVTLEDVIEELIGEEIVDELDVFVDVHKAIRRMQPAPIERLRVPRTDIVSHDGHYHGHHHESDDEVSRHRSEMNTNGAVRRKRSSITRSDCGGSPKATTFMVRRNSSLSTGRPDKVPFQMKQGSEEFRQKLRSLGPSNAAKQPRQTRVSTVTIKNPSVGPIPENRQVSAINGDGRPATSPVTEPADTAAQEGIGRDVVQGAGLEAKDGVQALTAGYGTWNNTRGGAPIRFDDDVSPHDERPARSAHRTTSTSTLGSMRDTPPDERRRQRGNVRSGSITEQFVDSGGMKKLVLETTSSSEDGDSSEPTAATNGADATPAPRDAPPTSGARTRNQKKREKQRRKKQASSEAGAANGSKGDESTPLLGR